MDPTQDVIAFLDSEGDTTNPPPPTAPRIIRIHIRTISTNAIHPLAQQSPLQIFLPPSDRYTNFTRNVVMYFARETFVLYFCTFDKDQPYVQIWDWTTSDVIVDCTLPFDRSISAREYEFGLLDSTYCFITDRSGAGSIRLYKLVRSPSAAHAPVHLATLHFPPTADDSVRVQWIYADATPLAAHPRPRDPFVLDDDDRLHVFMLRYVYRPGSFVVLNIGGGGVPLEVPWEEWGPVHTRLVYNGRILVQRHLLKYVYGQRAIWTRASTAPNTIEVLDFSLAAVLSAKDVEKGKRGTLVAASTIHVGQPPIFKHDVETCLPCVSTVWNLKREYALYMIYADGIVGVDRQEDFETRILHVYPV
ncbi:hypothetical protein BJ912DRAFT_1067939 [Pholiota molesta]|nr:hypothetical protein BJ912DRAFT_1067939 [Pholiota molesta]